ncbi:MAG: transposase [Rivularia sp. (in: cyanobacteria)]
MKGLKVFLLPTYSPHLNIIENIFIQLNRKIYNRLRSQQKHEILKI